MTPNNVAAIRLNTRLIKHAEIVALCDALESAWAEREEWKASHTHWRNEYKAIRERAERVQAAMDAWETWGDRPARDLIDRLRAAMGPQ